MKARTVVALLLCSAPAYAWGQESVMDGVADTPAIAPPPAHEASAAMPAPASMCCVLAAGTSVEIEIAEPLGSASHQRGQAFRIRLRSPVVVDGQVVVPAGTEGLGEVIHAERSRGGGKPGELLVAARHLEYGAIRIPLRGLKLGGAGRDTTHAALAVATLVGPFAHFVKGREIEIPVGTPGIAKVAAGIAVPPPAEGDPAPADAVPQTTAKE